MFQYVTDCRKIVGMGVLLGLDWCEVETKLRPRNAWTPRFAFGLHICNEELLKCSTKKGKAEKELDVDDWENDEPDEDFEYR